MKEDIKFIQETPANEIAENHLDVLFRTYQKLFGEVCTGCPTMIAGYIKRIKLYNSKPMKVVKESSSQFKLKGKSLIVIPGTNKAYSNANLTDEVAIHFLRKNPKRKALFSTVPENLEEILNAPDNTGDQGGDKALSDYKVVELREMYPDAKGRSKEDLIKSIEEIIKSKDVDPDPSGDQDGPDAPDNTGDQGGDDGTGSDEEGSEDDSQDEDQEGVE